MRDTLKVKETAGTMGSEVVQTCQVCGTGNLRSILFLGYLPPVNTMPTIGSRACEQKAYPAEMLQCEKCELAQLGLIVDPHILFPPSYPYTSGTTRILRENFKELASEVTALFPKIAKSLVVDVGSNDGTLLQPFKELGYKVHGIEPTNAGLLAREKGIPTLTSFMNMEAARKVKSESGTAKVVTAANVFAHIENIHAVVESVLELLDKDGLFISESHYLLPLIETNQYDTVYHEHLRYYSLKSITHLLEKHGLEVIHAKQIPTHGGSIRVYSAKKGTYPINESVRKIRELESQILTKARLKKFKEDVVLTKLELHKILFELKQTGAKIYGVGAPSRASTLINYVGLDDGILDCVLEIKGSSKIGKYIPGTHIPVREESCAFTEQPDYLLLLSWHIGDELMRKLKEKGFRGAFIVPLPKPKIVRFDN